MNYTFGKKVKLLRIESDLTLKQMSKIIGINSVSYLSSIENNKALPSDKFIEKLIKIQIFYDNELLLYDLLKKQKKENKSFNSLNNDYKNFLIEYQKCSDKQKKRIHRIFRENKGV